MTLSTPLKIASVVTSILFAMGAVAIGGGHPLSPARIAESTSAAARNAATAEENTARAAASTRSLLAIAQNVDRQVRSSRQLLETQLQLESSSRRGAERSLDLRGGIEDVRRGLASLRRDIAVLTRLSKRTVSSGRAAAAAGTEIESTLVVLQRRFEEVVRQSRRLNEKARGFQETRDGPG